METIAWLQSISSRRHCAFGDALHHVDVLAGSERKSRYSDSLRWTHSLLNLLPPTVGLARSNYS